jgi:hypothetical protein
MTTENTTRIYVVEKTDGTSERLVRASHKFGAHRHVTLSEYGTRLASQADLERLLGAGVKVESAKADPDTADLFEA